MDCFTKQGFTYTLMENRSWQPANIPNVKQTADVSFLSLIADLSMKLQTD